MPNVPAEGGRGFTLAKWGLQVGAGIVVLAFLMLYLGKLDASSFNTTLLLGAALCGLGPGGQMGANIVERWNTPPKE